MPGRFHDYILEAFDTALESNYIQPYYQPVIRTVSRQLCSFEALARWVDPVYGVIPPAEFIGILEDHRLIHKLDCSIMQQVCGQIRDTLNWGLQAIPVSINLSRLDFELCDILSILKSYVSQYRIPHNMLYIEVTESLVADSEGRMLNIIQDIRKSGFQIWMDDFGSGYSSLNLLKDFSFDELKIDMRFLSSFHLRSRKVLTSIINMSKDLDIHTLAEGVETEEQFEFLHSIGCEKVQGFLFGQPMPYDQAMAHLKETGIRIEAARERGYYEAMGMVNVLSPAPFMSRMERDSMENARQLNSLPLALLEIRDSMFTVLFYNAALEKVLAASYWGQLASNENLTGKSYPLASFPMKLRRVIDEAGRNGYARLSFILKGDYCEAQAKLVAKAKDVYSVLFQVTNLSHDEEIIRTNTLDSDMRYIYTLFERVALINYEENSFTPLLLAAHKEEYDSRLTLNDIIRNYSQTWISESNRQLFLDFMDGNTIEKRLNDNKAGFLYLYCLAGSSHEGGYSWKQYFLIRKHPGSYFFLVRDADRELRELRMRLNLTFGRDLEDTSFTPELLWKTLISSSNSRVFWKDADRRFVGVSKGFLDYYGFENEDLLRGKTDEDMGWHVHADPFKNDELRVLHEGISTSSVDGKCIARGSNADIAASKMPIYNGDGRIIGLLGFFVDKGVVMNSMSNGGDSLRHDQLSGLLNTRGISESSAAFQDEYYRRGLDFARVHIAIEDSAALNQLYGYDFGDQVIRRVGEKLQEFFGSISVIGRASGFHFIILYQFKDEEDLEDLIAKVKTVGSQLGEIEGIPLNIYLETGYCKFSEAESESEQEGKAEIRLLTARGKYD